MLISCNSNKLIIHYQVIGVIESNARFKEHVRTSEAKKNTPGSDGDNFRSLETLKCIAFERSDYFQVSRGCDVSEEEDA
ncbi:hypothetical protein scyTo_0002658 [Scyliorhinus torazame]|uniref:Uncharacterized protein n=1 Tax=Scyliorhinus torazame TaxID=75743 RepID=A0A401PKG6_SCYTO|nr:hypothetical protein [Scyliorhinus torazame]